MKEQKNMEALVIAIGETSDETWAQELREVEGGLQEVVSSFQSDTIRDAVVSARNIGRGADWVVLALSFAVAAWIVPELHRKLRENIEEWHRIYQELHKFFTRVLGGKPVLLPDQYLFLLALQHLPSSSRIDLELKGIARLPESNPDLQGYEALLFSFGDGHELIQIAVSRRGEVLWQNTIELCPIQHAST